MAIIKQYITQLCKSFTVDFVQAIEKTFLWREINKKKNRIYESIFEKLAS